jgi:carbon monoxide dehydrogenase subunit G
VKLSHSATIAAPRERVWKLVTDVPAAARCVPGVAAVTPAGANRYRGSLMVQLGPVRLVLDGDVALTATDEAKGTAAIRADAKDTRLGGTVRATMDLTLIERGEETELRIASDVQIAGRIGEFGQPVIQRKADQLMAQFAQCLARSLA